MSTDKSRKEKAKRENDLYRDTPSYLNKSLIVHLPIPPSINHMYVNKRNGTKVLTRTAFDFIRDARALINLSMEEQNWIKQEHAVWLYADIMVYMPDRKIRDSHNMLKILMDTLQGCVFDQDYFVMPRIHSVELDTIDPRIEVRITPQKEKDRRYAKNLTALVQ